MHDTGRGGKRDTSASAETKCRLFVVLHLDNNFALVTVIDRKTVACAMVALQADFIVTVYGAESDGDEYTGDNGEHPDSDDDRLR